MLLYVACAWTLVPWPILDPPLSDAGLMPPAEVVSQALAFNQAYRAHLEARVPLERWREAELQDAITETARQARPWQAIANAQQEPGSDDEGNDYRRYWLGEVRRLLGPDRYMRLLTTWELPPVVPLRLFQER